MTVCDNILIVLNEQGLKIDFGIEMIEFIKQDNIFCVTRPKNSVFTFTILINGIMSSYFIDIVDLIT